MLNWSISRNYQEIWNSTKISVTLRMYLTGGGSVQRPLTSGPRGWLARFYVSLARGFVHTCLHEKGKAQGGGESQWRPNHMVSRPPLGELPT
jgi:hypothetical protein